MKILGKFLAALIGSVALASAQTGEGRKEKPRPAGPQGEAPAKPRQKGEMRGERRGPGGPRAPRPHAERFMGAYDQNGDKEVTLAEFQASKKVAHLVDKGKRIFDHFDKNQDGRITPNELPKGSAGPNGGGSNGGRRRGDENGDGKIDLGEFLKNPRLKDVPLERRKEMFRSMDKDNDGVLTPGDFRRPRRGPYIDRATLEKLDENGDKALSFEEWRKNPRLQGILEERLKETFDRMDRNKDGKLDESERPEGPPRGPGPGGERPGGRGSEGRPPKEIPRGPSPKLPGN
ncbi:MAG: hypothetical protein ACKJSK_04895 [Roseibacillus sp.]